MMTKYCRVFIGVILSLIACNSLVAAENLNPRQTLSLDRGWRFNLGDIPFPVISGHGMSYNNAKAGTAGGAAAMDFDDSLWNKVNLPHDWALETPIDQKNNLAQGFHARGIGWYRRTFKLDTADRGKHLEIQFDGVATHSTVWVNGLVVARNWCGYTSFYVDITPIARYGNDTNTISVRVDADAQEGWWYEGAGIYRHTWLIKRSPVHITTDGVYANPIKESDGKWSIPAEITIESSDKESRTIDIKVEVIDPAGQTVASGSLQTNVDPLKKILPKIMLTVENPTLWSVDSPVLYTVRTTLSSQSEVIDQTENKVGFRTIRFDAQTGFYLNDQPLKLKGTCNHQDHAGVGVAVPDSIWDFRLKKLKEMGSNAYRCAHNPPAKEFLDACDRMGMLVMDENRNFNTSDEYVRQLQWLVRRDRNHPSVILWSVFNEEPSQGNEMGFEMVRRLSSVVKELDTSRPVTAAQSNAMLNPINASLAADVAGFNYRHGEYDRYHQMHPDRPITSSEDTSAVMTRGEYVTDKKTRFTLDSYDTQFQGWGRSHREGWKQIDTRPFLAGGFVWTGFDYRGEPQPLEWPATGSSFGIMDQCGFPKAAFYIHQSQWIRNRPVLQLIPHWNWAGSEGKPIKVMTITNASEVQLVLNGKDLERKPVKPYEMVEWSVPYEAGKLEAIAFNDGKEIARNFVETTGPAVALQLIPDRSAINNDGSDAMPVTVQAVDDQGRVVPIAKPFASFKFTGGGKIIGVGNGDPLCHESDKASSRTLFNGLAQVIVQSERGGTTPITLTATSEGLATGSVTINLNQVQPIPAVDELVTPQLVRRWKMSPASDATVDPNQEISRSDMNTLADVEAGKLQTLATGKFTAIRSTLRLRANIQKHGGTLILNNLTGKAVVYIDGNEVAKNESVDAQTMTIDLAPGKGERRIVVAFEYEKGKSFGLGGVVEIKEKNPG